MAEGKRVLTIQPPHIYPATVGSASNIVHRVSRLTG